VANLRAVSGCDLLVTGAGGFVGHHVTARAEAAGLSVAAFDGDLADRAATAAQVAELAPRWVIHLAARARGAGDPAPATDPWAGVMAELEMARSLVAALVQHSPNASLLVAGSASQYGMALPRPLREDDPLAPLTPYAALKCVLEQALTAQPLNAGLRVVWTRSFNHIGPGQPAGAPAADWARQVAEAERTGSGKLVTGTLDQVRDFLDVRDVADAYLALLRAEATGVVNVSSGVPVTLSDILEQLFALSSVELEHSVDESLRRPLDPPYVVGDPERLRELTGWTPQFSLEQSLRDALDVWRAA
jgi:GDP-4-dehydro-6-deoxy-D-mannose reductase